MKWAFIRGIDLLGHLPPVLREYEEFSILAGAEEPALIEVLQAVNRLYSNIFIDTAEEEAVKVLERQWNLLPQENATLEDRRVAILTRMLSFAALYTKRTLRQALETLCGKDGFEMEIVYEKYYLRLLIELKSKNQVESVKSMLYEMLPANMVYEVDIRYNQHITLHKLTHGEMRPYSHKELRESFNVRELCMKKG